MRGEFNFVFDIEIVFVVRRRTGGAAEAWDHVRSWPWQWCGNPVAGVPCPGLATAQLPLPSHCQVPEWRAECQSVWRQSPGDSGDSEE